MKFSIKSKKFKNKNLTVKGPTPPGTEDTTFKWVTVELILKSPTNLLLTKLPKNQLHLHPF